MLLSKVRTLAREVQSVSAKLHQVPRRHSTSRIARSHAHAVPLAGASARRAAERSRQLELDWRSRWGHCPRPPQVLQVCLKYDMLNAQGSGPALHERDGAWGSVFIPARREERIVENKLMSNYTTKIHKTEAPVKPIKFSPEPHTRIGPSLHPHRTPVLARQAAGRTCWLQGLQGTNKNQKGQERTLFPPALSRSVRQSADRKFGCVIERAKSCTGKYYR